MKKPFFPIQVQPGYTARGWLGFMCGSKYRFTMCKPERNESDMASLLEKIKKAVNNETNDEEPGINLNRKEQDYLSDFVVQ